MHRMKRWVRRTASISIGLTLGWLAAGWLSPSLVGSEETTPRHASHVAADPGGTGVGGTGEESNGAAALVPEPGTTPWLRPVLCAIGALFVAAVAVGLTLRAYGVRDPSIVATETDQAAAHAGHDDAHTLPSAHDAHAPAPAAH
jgi:hypothetical protein